MKTITLSEATERAKCSYLTIYRAIRAGDLQAYKPGKFVLIKEEDFLDWFESTKIKVSRVGRPRGPEIKINFGPGGRR
jgi:excisionase family DNA binding protein